jgi:hypothetical protein
MGYLHNLLVEDSCHIVIGPNNLDRNPNYDYGNANQSKNAVVFRNCEDCTISGLHLSNVHSTPAALFLDRCRRINLSTCSVLDSDGPGMLLRDVRKSLVTNCLIRDDRPTSVKAVSLRIEGGDDNTFANNVFAQGSETVKPPL